MANSADYNKQDEFKCFINSQIFYKKLFMI